MPVREVSARELKTCLDRGDTLVLLDVRQPWEYASGHLPGSLLLPLPDLPARLDELDPGADIVTICKVGERSACAAEYLGANGFPNVRNLRGGVYAWASEVDPSVLP
jgi:adenylyltransferase/sulfurtransferase